MMIFVIFSLVLTESRVFETSLRKIEHSVSLQGLKLTTNNVQVRVSIFLSIYLTKNELQLLLSHYDTNSYVVYQVHTFYSNF